MSSVIKQKDYEEMSFQKNHGSAAEVKDFITKFLEKNGVLDCDFECVSYFGDEYVVSLTIWEKKTEEELKKERVDKLLEKKEKMEKEAKYLKAELNSRLDILSDVMEELSEL